MAGSVYDYTFQCDTLEGMLGGSARHTDRVLVTHWRGVEAVSRPYRFEITVAVADADLALEKLLDKTATLTAKVPGGGTQQWHGIITRAGEAGSDETHNYYQVVLEPRLARLRNMQWSDIYLKRDLADLIKQLLANAGLVDTYMSDSAPYDYRVAAVNLARTRAEFTCQYEESCLDFLMRKLEYYGVYFWFEQGADREAIVFANDVTQQPVRADTAIYYPKGHLDADGRQIAIRRLARQVGLPPKTVVLHGHQDYSNTTLTLLSQAEVPLPPAERGLGEIHSVDDHFEQVESDADISGATLAQWRAQELACSRVRADGEAATPGIRAGRYLDVSEYHKADDPRQYYVIEITHEGTQPLETSARGDRRAYRGDFVALPRWLDPAKPSAPLQYRPPRVTPVPQVARLLNGFVDISDPRQPKRFAQPDEHGRYKVRFLFARERYDGDQNSAFVRMATPYAGGASTPGLNDAGMHFPLREGTEVLLAFLRGDPDRPVIVAALPNIEAPSPVNAKNSAQHVISTPGGNTVVLADAEAGGDGGPRVNLTSSTLDSTLNLGKSDEGDVADGFNLRTKGHGQITAGASMEIEVPDHYRMIINPKGISGPWEDLLSSARNLGPGINLNQNAGIVISNYLGANISSVEGLTVNNFFGVKADMKEALMFDTTIGAKLVMEWNYAKVINLRQAARIADAESWLAKSWNFVVGVAAVSAIQKTEKVGTYAVDAATSYSLSAGLANFSVANTKLTLAPTSALLETNGVLTISGKTMAVMRSDERTSIIGGTSIIRMDKARVSISTPGTAAITATTSISLSTSGAARLNGGIIQIG